MINIDDLTLPQVRELKTLFGKGCRVKPADVPLPFKPGDCLLVRTVTMIQVGRLKTIGRDFFVFDEGGWVADTGRFSTMLETGSLCEFEKAPSWFVVGRGAIVDIYPWAHGLPKATK